MSDWSWLATEPLYATPLAPREDNATGIDARLLVRDAGALYAGVLAVMSGEITVNGEPFDFGDDYPVILGLIDEVYDAAAPGEEIYIEAAER